MSHSFDPLMLAALPGLVAVVLWAVTDVERFASMAVLSAMVLPVALIQPGGTQVALADVLLIVSIAAWLVAATVRQVPRPMFRDNPMLLPGLLFVGLNLASMMWSTRPRDTLVFTAQVFEFGVLFPLVFASLTRSEDVMRKGLQSFVVVTGMLALFAVVKYAPHIAEGDLQADNLTGSLNKNAVGSFVSAGLVGAFSLFLTARRRDLRLVLGSVLVIDTVGLVSTVSRASIIAAVVAVVATSLLLGRGRFLTIGAVVVVAGGYLATVGVSSHADRRLAGSYDSSTVRTYSYQGGIDHIKERPLIGSGGGTYLDDIPELGIVRLPDPNNTFLLTWAELGIFGILSLGFILWRYGSLLLRVRRLDDALAVPAVAGGCMALTVFVHSQFDVTWTRGTSSLAFAMMGWMVAATRIAATSPAEPAPQPAAAEPAPIGVGPRRSRLRQRLAIP